MARSPQPTTALPKQAQLPINRCNLPAKILGSLTFQRHPSPLCIDGVAELHKELFESLNAMDQAKERAKAFKAYMSSSFLLEHLDEAGFDANSKRHRRDKADYLRMLRGWLFDPDGKEGAVLKSWVESRFGLLARNHKGPLGDCDNPSYQAYLHDSCRGLYNTNGLEAQLDLLFCYCQYEQDRRHPDQTHLLLYRGINRIEDHQVLARLGERGYVLVLNNLNSFTRNRERADEFGDYILEARVPLTKLLFVPGLLPDSLRGEEEYLVVGGVYEVELRTM